MAAIVHQKDKRSGITYAYESVSYWDKEKKQSRAKRRLIGRVEADGSIVPTDGRGRRRKSKEEKEQEALLASLPKRRFCGATCLLDSISNKLGLTQELKRVFGDRHHAIRSLAYYLILEGDGALYRFEKWSTLHKHPFGENIPSQRSSELFASKGCLCMSTPEHLDTAPVACGQLTG